ncbi:TraB/GumN family protein [Pseudoxanthomonas composti]|uniref:TraB/GumN family protein n=1 Tax=Pseudoxanthomonas composti TaxID=2137479 RepID=A0A4Q1K1M1_9GAMM|nr:TraB/GumN family protein [Pseudoxanthomonas composti]RXR08486.1 TraB/GumN family protein [Pseudoxanthomonas composti]
MRRGRFFVGLLLWVLTGTGSLAAQEAGQAVPVPSEAPITDLEAMVVSGVQPGPGLWKVSRQGHTLWVLGTAAPLPKRMEWRSKEVEDTIAQSQELLLAPTMTVSTGRGMFRSLFLVPSLLKARKNPDGKTLQDVVPPDQYARWSVLKARYIGRDKGVESWRPVFAAAELYEAAMKRSALSMDNVVREEVIKQAKRAGVPVTASVVTFTLDDPKAAIKEFQRTGLQDTACFARTLDVIETDIEAMRERANAWAVGDIQALRRNPQRDQYSACMAAVSESGIARKFGADTLRQQSLDLWLSKAEAALQKNTTSFGLLPLGLLLEPGNLMDRLKAKGYTVTAPEEG